MDSSGWSLTYFTAVRSMSIQNSDQIPESLTYQPSTGRVIVSNTIDGTFFGIPYSYAANSVTSSQDSMIALSSFNSSFGSFGMVVDPLNDTLVWTAISLRPPTATSVCAFELVDTTTNATLALYNFNSLRNPTLEYCFVNDVVVDNDLAVYATDFWGYQVVYLLPRQDKYRNAKIMI